MVNVAEEKGYKAKLLDNLETNSIICNKLSKEMGVPSEEPDSNLSLLKLQHTQSGPRLGNSRP